MDFWKGIREKDLVADDFNARWFDLAGHVWHLDYSQPIFFVNGRFFRSLLELQASCLGEQVPVPKWAWAVEPQGLLFDVNDVLGTAAATDFPLTTAVTPEEVERLQAILDEWSMEQGVVGYDIDYDTAVIFDAELYEAINAKSKNPRSAS